MFDRITRNNEILDGQPCIRNMRITVKEEDIKQALEYAAASLEDKIIDLKTA